MRRRSLSVEKKTHTLASAPRGLDRSPTDVVFHSPFFHFLPPPPPPPSPPPLAPPAPPLSSLNSILSHPSTPPSIFLFLYTYTILSRLLPYLQSISRPCSFPHFSNRFYRPHRSLRTVPESSLGCSTRLSFSAPRLLLQPI
ncbi:uncharacterized protein BO72DRAFT_91420 [Aspergillus fijiensis CBS 313.89]|uniref:Uncharacterized protein n=1 Tax=Aspergillus fijiensis CBS 313.89 TaxID=1448319 RepID=A0A8G1S4M3_9EURO|nr:uncharacterized protein BO72DRAFT_91420 [Aspergillus fijiensis CBS 313.89]RAK82431.1 hypothetical protein BO72DRAFT_91420 [Aspergillus fijiensis CBS 313.89]